jgi:hypothetical protein
MVKCWEYEQADRTCFGTIINWLEILLSSRSSPQFDETKTPARHVLESKPSTGTGTRHSPSTHNDSDRSPPPPLPPRVRHMPAVPGDYVRRRSDDDVSMTGLSLASSADEIAGSHGAVQGSRNSDRKLSTYLAFFESIESTTDVSNTLSPVVMRRQVNTHQHMSAHQHIQPPRPPPK